MGQVNDPAYIAHLNTVEGSLWRAAPQNFFEGLTFDDARVILGTRLSHISSHLNSTLPDSASGAADDEAPLEFDAREHWQGLIHPIRDQKHCGSCWAFSSSEVLSDRFAIATNQPSPVLSTQDMVSCDYTNKGCHGGNAVRSWQYFQETGVVTDTCLPYTSGSYHGAPVQECVNECADGEP